MTSGSLFALSCAFYRDARYRAPELLCFNVSYGSPVDMWSVGCIVGELLMRKPLFKGTDPRNQLEQIARLLGRPTEADLEAIMNEGALNFLEQLGTPGACTLAMRVMQEACRLHISIAAFLAVVVHPHDGRHTAHVPLTCDANGTRTLCMACMHSDSCMHIGGAVVVRLVQRTRLPVHTPTLVRTHAHR